ncbi:MAG TPA: M24 family metallopeptidase [Ktedonobacterales bacterium]|nr:M24 family metallopeptidase [Ktedonobacterales bacterium]
MADMDQRRGEIASKLGALRARMEACGVDVLHLTTEANTAWITAGATTYIDEARDAAAFGVAVTSNHAFVLADTIEEPRLHEEEQLDQLGFEIVAEPWYRRGLFAAGLGSDKRVGRDNGVDMSVEIQQLRMVLGPAERVRLREVCAEAAEVMAEAIPAVHPGMTEFGAAALLAGASRKRGGTATVALVGSDERIYRYRHSLPTHKPIERYAMLVLCYRRYGLVSALTRLVYFGTLPDELRSLALAVARVDAEMIRGTQPGKAHADMFALAKQAYTREGHPEAIEEHHQGGSIGYLSREILATPEADTPIVVGQAFAWNPSIRGAKAEDTILLGQGGPDVLTQVAGWPAWSVTVDGQEIARPAILEVPHH